MFVILIDFTFFSGLFILLLSDLLDELLFNRWRPLTRLPRLSPAQKGRASLFIDSLTSSKFRRESIMQVQSQTQAEQNRPETRSAGWNGLTEGWPLNCRRQKADGGRDAAKHGASENHRRLNQQSHMKSWRGAVRSGVRVQHRFIAASFCRSIAALQRSAAAS